MYISKIVNYENMQRCLSIGRRATKPALVTAGVLLSTYELLKQSLMQSGRLEESLSKVTSSKIGIHEGTVNSRSELLKRLKRYRMLFGIVNTSRESQILARLEHAIEDMETDVSTGALRKQPFCVVLYGNPGVGKSSFSIQLAQKLMHGRYGRFTSHDMVTLNETDEYQSEFRTSHKVVLFDDIGAAKSDRPDTTNPWRKVIDFVNNVQKTALNPNCEMKGKVYIQPDLVILTTNLDLSKTFAMVGGFMNCPEAIARRCSSVIHLKDYLTGEIINYDGGSDHSTAFCGKMPTNLKSGLGTTVTRDYIVEELDKRFREHMVDQQKFINKFNSYFDDLPTITEDYNEQSEIYELQAAIAPKYDPLHEERITNYLISHIDWDYYFCAYPYGHNEEVYYFDGYIYSSFGKYPNQAIRLHQDYMNELRQKMLDITPRPYQEEEVMDIPGLVAEGNTTSIKAESDTCIVSDALDGAFVCDDVFKNVWHIPLIPCAYIPQNHPRFPALANLVSSFKTRSKLRNVTHWNKVLQAQFKVGLLHSRVVARPKVISLEEHLILETCRLFEKGAIYDTARPYPHHSLICAFMVNIPWFPFDESSKKMAHELAMKALPKDQRMGWKAWKRSVLGDLPLHSEISVSSESTSESQKFSSSVACLDDYSTDTPPESITGDDYYRALLRENVSKPVDLIITTPPNSVNSEDNSSTDMTLTSSSDRSWKSQTEDEQCSEFIRLINFPKDKFYQSRHVQMAKFGEIDLVLEVEDFIFVVELKRSNHPNSLKRAVEQAERYSNVLSALRPDTRVFGITYTYGGIQVVCDNAKPFRSNVCDDLFKIIGYTKQPNV
jgi:hypothetical protein